jgi:hypothetical protein
MGQFLEREKLRQAEFKATSQYFSEAARAEGNYKGKSRPYCLPRELAEENLIPSIRQSAPGYFAKYSIKWHDGQDGMPSNHLCDSQVCCVNFLFPFASEPRALAELLRPIYPDIREMRPVENGQYVAFEWIGQDNYLCEKISRNGKRTRGANFTSADAMVALERVDGKLQVVLIEWKYTESYGGTPLKIAKSGTDRTAIYRPHYERDDCPLDRGRLRDFDSLFFEPFYQLLRQQLLAHEMEKAGELGAHVVSLLHIAPASNADFRKVTSPTLVGLGDTATGIWATLLHDRSRFLSVSTESLFGPRSLRELPEMYEWFEYISARYPWIRAELVTSA